MVYAQPLLIHTLFTVHARDPAVLFRPHLQSPNRDSIIRSGLAHTPSRGSYPLPDAMKNPEEFILQTVPLPSAPTRHIEEVGPGNGNSHAGGQILPDILDNTIYEGEPDSDHYLGDETPTNHLDNPDHSKYQIHLHDIFNPNTGLDQEDNMGNHATAHGGACPHLSAAAAALQPHPYYLGSQGQIAQAENPCVHGKGIPHPGPHFSNVPVL